MGLVDVYAATIPDFPFKPALHVNYQEAVLRVRDGLPKHEGHAGRNECFGSDVARVIASYSQVNRAHA